MIQLSGLDAVQPHALDVVTLIGIPVPPVVAIDCVCGVNEVLTGRDGRGLRDHPRLIGDRDDPRAFTGHVWIHGNHDRPAAAAIGSGGDGDPGGTGRRIPRAAFNGSDADRMRASPSTRRLIRRTQGKAARGWLLLHTDPVVVDDNVTLARNCGGVGGDAELYLAAALPGGGR